MTKFARIAHWITLGLMAVVVLGATVDGFAQSWAALYGWAIEHGLHGWKAMAFPGLIDAFILVGELGLFALALEGHRVVKGSKLSWLDLALPGGVAAAGWAVSLGFNIGHVDQEFTDQLTAGVPPIASMLGLLILLRTLHRLVTRPPVAVEQVAERFPALGSAEDTVHRDLSTEANASLAQVTGINGKTYAPNQPPRPEPDPLIPTARERFAEVLATGSLPSVRQVRAELRVGHPRATAIREALTDLAIS